MNADKNPEETREGREADGPSEGQFIDENRRYKPDRTPGGCKKKKTYLLPLPPVIVKWGKVLCKKLKIYQ